MLESKMSERHVSYVAYLIHMNGAALPRPRKVIVALCPKQVIIREYILKIIPKKLMTFRLSPSTKVIHCATKTINYAILDRFLTTLFK